MKGNFLPSVTTTLSFLWDVPAAAWPGPQQQGRWQCSSLLVCNCQVTSSPHPTLAAIPTCFSRLRIAFPLEILVNLCTTAFAAALASRRSSSDSSPPSPTETWVSGVSRALFSASCLMLVDFAEVMPLLPPSSPMSSSSSACLTSTGRHGIQWPRIAS